MKLDSFQKTALTTVAATLFLIFVGGLVRAAGAGLGCPDWPQCFGMWIPPTSVEQLPPQFDPSQYNMAKMWIEYVNRLVGVVIGLLIIATAAMSLRFRKTKSNITVASVASLALVVFQGWLGGQVVRSALDEWLITLHMLLAMVIVNLLIYATFKALTEHLSFTISDGVRKHLFLTTGILLFAALLQMGMGTQVREAIDAVVKANPTLDRSQWLENVGFIDHLHRSTSWSLLILGVYLGWFINKSALARPLVKAGYGILLLIVFQIILGVGLAYMGMPAAFQVLHLTFAAFLVSALIVMLYLIQEGKPELQH
jgi:cytochrome c oxidase assembly protein subunit 15